VIDMNESSQLKENEDDKFRDTKENWIAVVLFFNRPRFEVYRDIIVRVALRMISLKKEEKIEKWHFRFGSYGCGPDVSFRLKPRIQHKSEVLEYVKELAKKLKQEGLIHLYSFTDPKWISSDEAIVKSYGSWLNWHLTTSCDELLSETVYTIMTHPDYEESKRLFHDAVVHELFNMFAQQELHCFYRFSRGRHRALVSLLDDQSARNYGFSLFGKGYDMQLSIVPQRSVFFFDFLELYDSLCKLKPAGGQRSSGSAATSQTVITDGDKKKEKEETA